VTVAADRTGPGAHTLEQGVQVDVGLGVLAADIEAMTKPSDVPEGVRLLVVVDRLSVLVANLTDRVAHLEQLARVNPAEVVA
jgi:hypothetical protein